MAERGFLAMKSNREKRYGLLRHALRLAGLTGRHVRRSFWPNRSASAATIFALSLLPMVLAVGGAVDFSGYYEARASLQAALDSSVLAGAAKGSADEAANTFNAWKVKINGAVVATSAAQYTGCTSSSSTCTGRYSTQVKTVFVAIAGLSSLPLTVNATAEKAGSGQIQTGNLCLMLVDKNASPGLNVNGGTIAASGCEVDVWSTSSHAVTFDRSVTINKICVAGTSSVNVSPSNYYQSCTVQPDPYAGKLPTVADAGYCPSASGNDDNSNNPPMDNSGPFSPVNIHCNRININGGTHTFYPGVYGGGINFNNAPTVTFMPGLYVIKNVNWNLNGGTYTGSDVTFYYATSGAMMQYNNNAGVTLSAPTSGTYSGILMYEPAGLSTSAWTMNVHGTFTGALYMPSRDMTFNSNSVTTSGLWVLKTLISSTTFTMATSSTAVAGGSGTVVRLKK